MSPTSCIFCRKKLDGSDEHVIPDSLNGKLHSKEIICGTCNNTFGLHVDPVLKKLLNPLLIALGFDNATGVHVEGLDKENYLLNKTGQVSPLKVEVKTKNHGNKSILNIYGATKPALKKFQKEAKKLVDKGLQFKAYILDDSSEENNFKMKFEINVSPELILGMNKIAVEYFALCGLDTSQLNELPLRIGKLDKSLNNVTFCNWNCDLRDYLSDEITHLIMLKRRDDRVLYCYIEIFNVLCACIPLIENYPEDISFIYYQDAITGEKLNRVVELKRRLEFTNDSNGDFDLLINSTLERHREIEFRKIYSEETEKVIATYKKEIDLGVISESEEGVLEERVAKMIAQLTIDFPYMVEDFKDEMNDELNAIHSNLREEQFESFCEKYNFFIGKDIKINGVLYKFDSFVKTPFLKRNNVLLLKVYVSLINSSSGKQKFYPYSDFFRMLNKAYPEIS